MTVTHTTRKGKTYYLHEGTTKTGKPKYFFALHDEGDLVANIPPGYEIYENADGQVFLRKVRPQLITDEEVATVEAGMQNYCRLEHYIVCHRYAVRICAFSGAQWRKTESPLAKRVS